MEGYLRKTNRFLWEFPRLLRGLEVAAKLGPNAALLLRLVLEHEDRNRFDSPAMLTITQLMSQMGLRREAVREARSRAVEAGWLVYVPSKAGARDGDAYWTRLPEGLQKELESDLRLGFRIDLEPEGNLALDGKTIILGEVPTPQKIDRSPCRKSTLSKIDRVTKIDTHPVENPQGTLSKIGTHPDDFRQGQAIPTSTLVFPSPKTTPSPQAGVSVSRCDDTEKPKTIDALFAEVWAAYPKQEAPGRARDAFAAAIAATSEPETLVRRMLAAIDRAKRSDGWRRERGRWIPLLANWIHDERWNDTIIAPESQAERTARNVRQAQALRDSLDRGPRTLADLLPRPGEEPASSPPPPPPVTPSAPEPPAGPSEDLMREFAAALPAEDRKRIFSDYFANRDRLEAQARRSL